MYYITCFSHSQYPVRNLRNLNFLATETAANRSTLPRQLPPRSGGFSHPPLSGAYPGLFFKHFREVANILIPAQTCGVVHGFSFSQKSFRLFYTHRYYVILYTFAGFLLEYSRNVSSIQIHMNRNILDRNRFYVFSAYEVRYRSHIVIFFFSFGKPFCIHRKKL